MLVSWFDSSILANRLRRMDALFLEFLVTNEAEISPSGLSLLGLAPPAPALVAVVGAAERFGLLDGLEDAN